jgi:hypothetical protein
MLDTEMDVPECTAAATRGRPRRDDAGMLPATRRRLPRIWPLAGLLVLMMTTAVPTALAGEPTSGYGPPSTTTTTTTTTPPPPSTREEPPVRPETNEHPYTTGATPSKEATRPEEVTRPEEAGEPLAAVAREPHRALPFTGLDIRLELTLGVLLIAAGFPLLRLQRRGGCGRAQGRPEP